MAFVQWETDGVVYHRSTLLDLAPGVRHGFSTRLGGVSRGVYASMNFRGSRAAHCPDLPPDEPDRVGENYRRFCAALGVDPRGLVLSKQVHEDTVRAVTELDAGKGLDRPTDYTADALVTNRPGMSLMVFSADCIILLLHDPVTGCIGAVHAGWRGTALDLPAKCVGEMARRYGARPEDIRAAVGAGIGPCCFETHADVPEALYGAFGKGTAPYIRPKADAPGAERKWQVDLKEINAWRLREAGVEQIDVCPLCTACNPALYWSHRRTGDRRGVQGAVIGLPPRKEPV